MKLSDERIEQLLGYTRQIRLNHRTSLECDIDSALTELQIRREMDGLVKHKDWCPKPTLTLIECTCGLDALKKKLEEL